MTELTPIVALIGCITGIASLIGLMASPYVLTSKGEEVLPEDVKIKIWEIVGSKKFRKIAKKDSVENVVPMMVEKVGMDRLGEVASKAEMNTADIAIVASLYALNRFKEKKEVKVKRRKK